MAIGEEVRSFPVLTKETQGRKARGEEGGEVSGRGDEKWRLRYRSLKQ